MDPTQGPPEVIPYAARVRPPARANRILLALAFAVGVGGNAVALWAAWSLWPVPPGSSIRPMAPAALICLSALGSLAAGVPLTVVAWARSPNRLRLTPVALVAVLLCLSPGYAGSRLWKYIEVTHGLIMEP